MVLFKFAFCIVPPISCFSSISDFTTRGQWWCVQPSRLHSSASPGWPWTQPACRLISQTFT